MVASKDRREEDAKAADILNSGHRDRGLGDKRHCGMIIRSWWHAMAVDNVRLDTVHSCTFNVRTKERVL